MAKFLKSLFHPGEKKRSSRGEGRAAEEEDRSDFTPPLDGRRKLSISRSGRMKQNNKRRASLTKDLFGEDLHMEEKPASKEYYVHGKAFSETQGHAAASSSRSDVKQIARDKEKQLDISIATSASAVASKGDMMTPEEEIENAFKIIDNT